MDLMLYRLSLELWAWLLPYMELSAKKLNRRKKMERSNRKLATALP